MTYCKEDPSSVVKLFGRIAPSYDMTNLALSMGLCSLWMRKLVKELQGEKFLGDLCGGTGAVALAFLQRNLYSSAIVYDFSQEMLAIAERRLAAYQGRSAVQCGDCHHLPYEDRYFGSLSMAYGLRNLQRPLEALKECYRVLKPGGKLWILELTRPKSSLLFSLHKLYLKIFVPLIGRVMTKDRAAYSYLAKSIAHFPPPEEIEELLLEAGFSKVKRTPLSFGIATLLSAQKEEIHGTHD